MNNHVHLITQLDAIFAPRSIAIVGLPRGMKMGKLFLIALRDQGYPGEIYPVHPDTTEIDGLRTYPTVSSIDSSIDLAIILVPHDRALSVVRECAEKGVRGAILFTAGYKETGTTEGKALEDALANVARCSGMRLFGPNCMGLYCPKTGLSFFPQLSKQSGPVGLISHSGSLANILARMGSEKGIHFSKAVSLGNECDLQSADLLAYLGNDPDTGVIGAYLEGVKDGVSFFMSLREASLKKPVILWRVGLNPEGSRAAASHTGALAGSGNIWKAVVQQTGAISVSGFEALVDCLMGFSMLPEDLGDRIAILSGPGGLAVAAAEACGNYGLKLADLADKTVSRLKRFIASTGTSLANPVDVGLTASMQMEIYIESARALAADPGVDSIMVIGAGLTDATNWMYIEGIIEIQRDSGKPFIVVNIPGFDPALASTFFREGVPFFDSVERAITVYAHVRRYQVWNKDRSAH